MGHHTVRNDINYGDLDVVELLGHRFVAPTWRLGSLDLEPVVVAEIPEFNKHLTLHVVLQNHANEVLVHVLDKADVRKVAAALSRHTGLTVKVEAYARILAIYRYGEQVGEVLTLDHFYSNLSAEQIRDTTF